MTFTRDSVDQRVPLNRGRRLLPRIESCLPHKVSTPSNFESRPFRECSAGKFEAMPCDARCTSDGLSMSTSRTIPLPGLARHFSRLPSQNHHRLPRNFCGRSPECRQTKLGEDCKICPKASHSFASLFFHISDVNNNEHASCGLSTGSPP